MAFTKKDISRRVSKEVGITNTIATSILDKFIDSIKENSKNNKIKISRFGSFFYKSTPERIGRNPMNGKEYKIKSFKRFVFNSSNSIKNILN